VQDSQTMKCALMAAAAGRLFDQRLDYCLRHAR
jgi:hypothetical protein